MNGTIMAENVRLMASVVQCARRGAYRDLRIPALHKAGMLTPGPMAVEIILPAGHIRLNREEASLIYMGV